MWKEILIVLAVVLPINLILLGLAVRYLSQLYSNQFKNLAIIIREAMAQRDAQVAKYKAMFTQDLIRDAGGAFDTALEDLSDFEEELEEEIANECEADNSEGTG
jgi:hypothetical protein